MNALKFRSQYASILLFAASLAAHGVISVTMSAPAIFEDEYVFTGLARMLAGNGTEPDLNKYYPGLSFLLTPIYLITNDQQVAYRAAQALNVLLVSLMAPLAFYVFRRLAPQASLRSSVLVGVLALLYPAYLLTHAIVWSEALTAVAVMAVGAFGIRVWSAPTPKLLFALGLVAALTVLTHQRAVTIPVALVIVLIYLWLRRQVPVSHVVWPTVGVVVGGIATLVALVAASVPVVRPTIVDSVASGTNSMGSQLSGFVTLLIGQTFYFVAASGGLAAVAVVGTISIVANRNPGTATPATFISLFFVSAGILTLLVSAGFLRNGTRRADYAIYGRYAEVLIVPVIVIGIAFLWGIARDWSQVRLFGTTVGSVALLGAATIAVQGAVIRLPLVPVNIVALSPAFDLSRGLDLRIALVIGLTLSTMVAAWLSNPDTRSLAVVAIAIVWLTAFVFAYRPTHQFSDQASQRIAIVEAIETRDSGAGTVTPCIATIGEVTTWMYYHFLFQLAPRVLETANPEPCSQYLLTIDAQDAPPGARLIAVDSAIPVGAHRMLWIVDYDR